MKNIYTTLLVLFIVYLGQIKAYTFGSNGNEHGVQFIKTSDGGFLLLGQSTGTTHDIYLVKVDSLIQMQWSKIIVGGDPAFAAEVPTSDGFLVIGKHDIITSSGGAWLLRTNSMGDTLWTRTYQDIGFSYYGTYVEARSANDYVVGLSYDGPTTTNYDVLFSSDSSGTDTAFLCLGGYRGVILPITNGYLFTTTNFGGYNGAIDLTRYDSIGNNSFHIYIADDVTYSYHFYGNSSIEMSDGGFITVGCTNFYTANSVLYEYYLLRTNANGDSIWTHRWGTTNEIGLKGIAKVSDNEFYIHGQYDSASTAHHFIWKTDTLGDTTWLMNLDTSLSISKMYMIGNGNFAVIGDSTNSALGTSDVWFAIFDSDGNIISNNNVGISATTLYDHTILIYPNPLNGLISIDRDIGNSTLSNYTVKISDAVGKTVYSTVSNQAILSLDLKSKVCPGVYVITISDAESQTIYSKKLIIE